MAAVRLTIDEILKAAQQRIIRIGGQEAQAIATSLKALAHQHQLHLQEIGFESTMLRVLPKSFGYGTEPVITCFDPFKVGVIGDGATVIYPPGLGGTTLPAHDYQIARFITPTITVPPPAAAAPNLFGNDQAVAATFQQFRQAFVDSVKNTIVNAKRQIYGSLDLLVYDVIGSMTMLHRPELRIWANLPGDMLCFRLDMYIGLTIIPGRAVAAEAAGADTPASNQGQDHGHHAEDN